MAKVSEILDVHLTAELHTVSQDTGYDLFKKGELPSRKVGRKRLTTGSAVLRWIESTSQEDTLARAIEQGDPEPSLRPLRQARSRSRGKPDATP
jgi:excisionase family DNA binding protein